MYAKHFGLHKLPFENVPDPTFFFDEGDHARVRTRIEESLKAGRGISIILGHIGSGKTTISQIIKADFSKEIKLIWMAEPPGNSIDLFLFIAQDLGLTPSTSKKIFVLRDIGDALLKMTSEGNKCLIIIDEAHLMTDDTVNGIRLLNNLEVGAAKLIQILLLGQEELMNTINRPEMEAFKQRIATLEVLGKMNADGIRKYISHRLHVAGGQPSLFTDTGWEALILAFASGSTPRVINSMCDRSLTLAYERGKTRVDVDDVYEAAQGLGLQKEIFFYKVALKKGEQQEQPRNPAAGINGSAEKAMKKGKEHINASVGDSEGTDMAYNNKTIELSQSINEESGIDPFQHESTDRKGIKIPLILLFLSIILLVASVFFYCQKSGSRDILSCLGELTGL